MKTVLFYTPFAGSEPHFETELELIEQYLAQGYKVTILSCGGELLTCELNPYHRFAACYRCQSRCLAGIKWIGRNRVVVEPFYYLTEQQDQIIQSLKKLTIISREHLQSIEIEGSDIGMAALSSVISFIREPYPDIQKYQSLISRNLVSAAIVHFSIKNHLIEKKPDCFILYNGRFAALRPALRIAQALEIETYIHEVAGTLDRYILTKNSYSHDIALLKQEIEAVYQTSKLKDAEKLEIAQQWFEERVNHQDQGFGLFTEHQSKGLIPESLDCKIVNVVIFNSSEDEFAAVEEWNNPFYKDQNSGIQKILDSFQENLQIKFFLRIHPHLKQVENSQTLFLKSLEGQYKNLELIKADSPISTYALIKASDLVLTFGSTVGIEAVYLQKPSILMGRAMYEDLGGCIQPKNHEELIQILIEYIQFRTLPKVGNAELAVTKYGFFQKQYGYLFEHAKRHTLYKVSLEKDDKPSFIKPSFLARILAKLERTLTNYINL